MNNMENISSKEYADAYFAEEEEMKMGTHPSQIIPRATEELKSRGYDVDNIIIWNWHDNDGTVKIKFSDGEVVSYDYINNQIINNRSENIISNQWKIFHLNNIQRHILQNSKSKYEYLMDWVHGLYNTSLNIHISEYNKLHLDNNILRDDVIVVKGMVSLFMNAHYGSCLQYKHVDHETLSEKLKSYMLKYQQICNYLNENV